ncbi:cutinase-domain-containing protein [Thozetella sp. PMI_491]|nr:cutinase-domain-containing protein [Thozetella sp. PMI_491]
MRLSRATATCGLLAAACRADDTSGCDKALHIIVARGSTEAPGVGRIGVVAGNVSLALPGSSIAAVDYPATFEDYIGSESAGVLGITQLLANYTKQCPNGKVALLGYSQGGQAVIDTLCGHSEYPFNDTSDLGDSYKANIVAAVTFGDPSHVVAAPWNAGTSKKDGIFQRKNLTACEPYTDIIKGWCDTGDIYCDSGNVTGVHGSYFANYTKDATNFIVGKYNASLSTTGPNATITTSSPTPSSTASSTGPKTTGNAGAAVRPSTVTAGGALVLAFLYAAFV